MQILVVLPSKLKLSNLGIARFLDQIYLSLSHQLILQFQTIRSISPATLPQTFTMHITFNVKMRFQS